MAWDLPGVQDIGQLKAGADYSAETNQFLFVNTTANWTAKVQATKGGAAIGVLQNRPNSSQSAVIRPFGVTKVRVTAATHTAINPGDKLIVSSGGGARATTGTALAQRVMGVFLESLAANTTGIVTALLNCMGAGSTTAQGAA